MLNRARACRLGLLATCAALLLSASQVRAADPIRIGCIAALSGAGAEIGNRQREGAELAVAETPAINGRPVELVVRDSRSNPSVAQQQAASLMSEGVSGLLCVSLSSEGEALSAAARAGRLSIPDVQSSAVADSITGKSCNPWTFRTVPSATEIANAVARFQSDHPELGAGWYILGSDYLYGRSSGKSFAAIPGVKVLGETYAPLDTTDWTPYLNKVLASGAKGLWLPVALGSPYVQLMNTANNLKLLEKFTVLAPTGLPQDLIDQLGASVSGIVEPASAAPMTLPELAPVVAAYVKAHGAAPSEGVLQSYVAATAMLQAIAAAKSAEPADVRDALQHGRFHTAVGDFGFRAGDQQALAPLWLAKIDNLPQPIGPARFGFATIKKYAPEEMLPPLTQTACVPQ
jgi:branched-chain amino acid transport system substrate-binding protein